MTMGTEAPAFRIPDSVRKQLLYSQTEIKMKNAKLKGILQQ